MDDNVEELLDGPVQLSTEDFRRQLDGDLRRQCLERKWTDPTSRRGWTSS